MVEVTEKGAQRPAHRLACFPGSNPGRDANVADHALLVDLAQGGGAAEPTSCKNLRMTGRWRTMDLAAKPRSDRR